MEYYFGSNKIICAKCGTEVIEGVTFCPNCGNNLQENHGSFPKNSPQNYPNYGSAPGDRYRTPNNGQYGGMNNPYSGQYGGMNNPYGGQNGQYGGMNNSNGNGGSYPPPGGFPPPGNYPPPGGMGENFTDSFFIHESDRAALNAMKAIPGFTAFFKGFMNVWSERQFRIQNMASKIKLGPNQMPEIYSMLPPICEKLRIPVPELYLELNVNPNAYTYGDTNPFITITSGLLETMPMEMIPTVLAHECGHIACHHTLYTTMGTVLLNGAAIIGGFFGLGRLISVPLQAAFYHWQRCSEFSADRAAAVYHESAEPMTDVCMRLAGWDKNIEALVSKELFMQQAYEYKEMVANSKWDKSLELLSIATASHPFTAVRAYEIDQWAKTDEFKMALMQYKK